MQANVSASVDGLESTAISEIVVVTQVEDSVMAMEGATATQDTLGSTVMR